MVPIVAPALNPGQVAVGFAETQTNAVGVVVNVDDLFSERRYSQSFSRLVFRVTPFERDGSITYLIDHDDPKLQAARSVPANPPFVVGVNYFGLVRAAPGGEPETLWPGGKGSAISEPMFATVPGVGHAVVFARGRFGGSAHVGWLTESGQPKTTLATLEMAAHELGAPIVAAGESAIAVAIAVRDERTAPWRIRVASAAHGQLPRKLEPTSAGAGPDRTQPMLTSLQGGGWLLSWIEGAVGERRVRARALGPDLSLLDAPFDISNASGIADARGTLFRVGSHVLSFFVVKNLRGHELWAAALECA